MRVLIRNMSISHSVNSHERHPIMPVMGWNYDRSDRRNCWIDLFTTWECTHARSRTGSINGRQHAPHLDFCHGRCRSVRVAGGCFDHTTLSVVVVVGRLDACVRSHKVRSARRKQVLSTQQTRNNGHLICGSSTTDHEPSKHIKRHKA